MEGRTHQEYVAAALTTLQIEQRFSVWHPPRKFDEQALDICTRFCDMSRERAAAVVAKLRDRKATIWEITIVQLTTEYEFDIRQAYLFCQASLWIQVRMSLRSLETDELVAIVQGAQIK